MQTIALTTHFPWPRRQGQIDLEYLQTLLLSFIIIVMKLKPKIFISTIQTLQQGRSSGFPNIVAAINYLWVVVRWELAERTVT